MIWVGVILCSVNYAWNSIIFYKKIVNTHLQLRCFLQFLNQIWEAAILFFDSYRTKTKHNADSNREKPAKILYDDGHPLTFNSMRTQETNLSVSFLSVSLDPTPSVEWNVRCLMAFLTYASKDAYSKSKLTVTLKKTKTYTRVNRGTSHPNLVLTYRAYGLNYSAEKRGEKNFQLDDRGTDRSFFFIDIWVKIVGERLLSKNTDPNIVLPRDSYRYHSETDHSILPTTQPIF